MKATDLPDDVRGAHQREVPPRNAQRDCGICGGTLRRVGQLAYHPWRGQKTVCVSWVCQNCDTGGNVLRDPESGEVLRLSHAVTGNGFEVVGVDDLSAEPEAWRTAGGS